MTAAVDCHDAFRIYQSGAGGTVALQGLTLTVNREEIVVALGPSGSGKSTLLRALAGFERLSAGTVHVLGTEIGRLDARQTAAFRARHLGLLDQHYARSLSPDLSCLQSIGLQLRLLGATRKEARDTAFAALERVGLRDRADDRPTRLSGGEQQRVAVCAAVAHRPRLLLADEPAGELDTDNAHRIYTMIADSVREADGSALIVSHDAAAAAIADRLIYIRDGRIVEEAKPDQPRSLVVSHGWVRIPETALRQAGRPSRLSITQDGGQMTFEGLDGQQVTHDVPAGRLPDETEPPITSQLQEVSKHFGSSTNGQAALDNVSCSFRAGTFTAVVGRSGSGKTTLLHLLAGLERPSSGTITLHGEKLEQLNRTRLAELRRNHIALVTQEPGLVPYLTALENLQLSLALRGHTDNTQTVAEQALTEVGLQHRLHLQATKLSAGERQRVAVARALAARADLLLIDEPTARLDEENAQTTAQLLSKAAHQHRLTVVCATHDPILIEAADEIVPLARRIEELEALPST